MRNPEGRYGDRGKFGNSEVQRRYFALVDDFNRDRLAIESGFKPERWYLRHFGRSVTRADRNAILTAWIEMKSCACSENSNRPDSNMC